MSDPIPLPPVAVSWNYVLILEWLDEDDRRTGQQLHDFLFSIGMRSVLVVCSSADDVRNAVASALHRLPTLGLPVIHIESHATDPAASAEEDLEFGMNAVAGLPWEDLGEILWPLNRAGGHQLLVVGAACFGFGAIAAMNIFSHQAPFAATLGFTTNVTPGSVAFAMREFYRSLRNGMGLRESAEAAQRELRAGERFELTTARLLGLQVLRGAYDDFRTPETTNRRVSLLLSKAAERGLQFDELAVDGMPTQLVVRSRVRCEEVWNTWFPVELQHSIPTFRFDWGWVTLD